MNKLIKISDQHYVVVDDSEIEEGNYAIHNNKEYREKYKEQPILCTKSNCASIQEHWDKITHSTQSLGIGWQQEVIELQLSEVEELVSGYSAYNHKAEEQIRRIKESGEYISDLMMQSIMPKTEWDIEFDENGKITLLK